MDGKLLVWLVLVTIEIIFWSIYVSKKNRNFLIFNCINRASEVYLGKSVKVDEFKTYIADEKISRIDITASLVRIMAENYEHPEDGFFSAMMRTNDAVISFLLIFSSAM